jgi:hypothetical protein
MLVYYFWFISLSIIAFYQKRIDADVSQLRYQSALKIGVFFLLVSFIGLRHEVGSDWKTYLEHIDLLRYVEFHEFWQYGDPAYALLNWIGSNIFGDVYFVNTICAILFCSGLFAFAWSQPRPWLVLMISFPYLILVVSMGYTRQGVAIGLLLLAFVALTKGSLLRFVFWVVVAALFHKSVLIFLPMAAFSVTKKKLFVLAGIFITSSLAFYILILEGADTYVSSYVASDYDSAGAVFRIALNVMPAIIYCIFQKRFDLEQHMQQFWLWVSITALLLVPLLYFSPSTTLIDRFSLYWIPLQLFVLGRLPDIFDSTGRHSSLWVLSVIVYSGSVLYFWLNFADHASFWVPYRLYF